MSKALKTFKKNLKAIVDDRRLTQQELADLCGMKRAAVTRLLGGQNEPSLETVERVAKALKKEPWQLIYEESAESGNLSPVRREIIALFSALQDDKDGAFLNIIRGMLEQYVETRGLAEALPSRPKQSG